MNFKNIEQILKDEPKYRLKQAKDAVFKQLIEDWQEASGFSLALREKLNKEAPLLIKAETFASKKQDSIKTVLTLGDGLKIETVLMRHEDSRNTVCVSSQVGCPLGCKFCATGKMGFLRNLEPFEIVAQVLFFSRLLKKENQRVTNIVFMGMGEPFLNYDNVIKAIRILNDQDSLNIGARHISISTIGIIEGIKKLSEENLQVNLAISLHAPDDELRETLMPVAKTYKISDILNAVNDYLQKTNRKVMFEYLLLDNVNDKEKNALELAKIMKHHLYFLNLILYNPTGTEFKVSSRERIKTFKQVLTDQNIDFVQRYRFGEEVHGACGQLAAKTQTLNNKL